MPPLSYNGELSLAERFRKLLRDGTPPADAVEQLAELYYAFHFRIVQRLPGDPLFRLGANDELVVELDGRRLDPERILTREPGVLDPVPIPLDKYRWMCADPRQAERDALAELTIEVPTVLPPEPPAIKAEPDRGGKDPDHDWEGAISYAGKRVLERGRALDRHERNSKPNYQRGVELMETWFVKVKKDPQPPTVDSIRRWIRNNRSRVSWWWDEEQVAQLLRTGPNRSQP